MTQIKPLRGVNFRPLGPHFVKKGKINIFLKLKELGGCRFLILSPHFPPGEVRLQQFQTPPTIGYPELSIWGCQKEPKIVQKG